MTLRLSNLFEEQLKKVFKRSSSRLDRPARGRNDHRRSGPSTSHAHTNGGPSTSRHSRVRRHSTDVEEDVDVVNGETPSTSTGRPMRQNRGRQSNQMTNGVSSSHTDAGPSGYRNKRTRRMQSDNDSEASSDSSDSETSNESENYEPIEPKSNRKTGKKKKNKRKKESTAKRPRRLQLHESSEEEQPQEETTPVSSQNGRRTRGRPRKNQISDDESENEEAQNDSEEEEEEEAEEQAQSEEVEESEEEQIDEEESSRPRRATRQSPIRSTRRSNRQNRSNNSDDSDAPLRPKRNTSKRSQDDDDDSFEEASVEISTSSRRTVTSSRIRRQITNDSTEGSPCESTRPTRSTRQTPTSSRNNGTTNQDSDDDSDDDQLLSHFANQNRSKRSQRTAPPISTEFVDTTSPIHHQNGNPLQRTREVIRRRQTTLLNNSTTTVSTSQSNYHSITRSMTTSETTSQIEIRRNQVQEDHNYGEPGPSTLRYSRRVNQLSRHQQSPDEHNKSHSSIAESSVDPLRVPENISGRLRNRTPKRSVNIENDSDPDDDKPLHLMVSESPTRGRPSRQSTRYSDEHVSQSQAGSSSTVASSTRRGRVQKRPHYNEDTDEEDSYPSKRQATQGRYVTFPTK